MLTFVIRKPVYFLAAMASIASATVLSGNAEAAQVRAAARSNVNTANVNRSANVNRNVNVNQNVNVNRNVNVDVDRDYHPVATAAAVTAAATVTAAAVGSIVQSVPPTCQSAVINGIAYQSCGGTWYQPQYVGTTVQYVVVAPPQ
jgi:hypothetical protein